MEAEANFRKAIQLNPKFVCAYYNLAVLLDELEWYQEALQAIDRAIFLDPYDSGLQERRSEILANLEKHISASALSRKHNPAQYALESVQAQEVQIMDDCLSDLIQEIEEGETVVFCGAGI